MDSNTLSIIGTFIVAIITGLLAYSASLSTKEKEIKLSVFEKLGLDSHALIEKLYSNTEWHALTFQYRQGLTRSDLIAAGTQQPLDIDKIRELRVRLKFFDKKCYLHYEKIIQAHGELIPKIYGYVRLPGEEIIPGDRPYTSEEQEFFVDQLTKLSQEIDVVKEYITNIASKKYRKTISSSRIVTGLTVVLLVLALLAFFSFPLNEKTTESSKEKVTLLRS